MAYYSVGGTLFSHGNGQNKFVVSITNNGTMQLTIGNQNYVSNVTIPQNKWVFITFNYTYDESQCLFSAVVAEDANTFNLFTNENVVKYTGYGKLLLGAQMEGAIHETSLWNRARSTTEALSEKNSTKSASTPNLIGYWKFNEGEGIVATDYARNRHMSLNSNSWYLNNKNISVDLNGTNYLNLDITRCPISATEDYAFEMWFKAGIQSDTVTLFSIGNKELAIGFAPNGNMIMTNDHMTSVVTTHNYLDSTWHHLALNVLRNGNANIYVDGINVKQVESSLVSPMAATNINIGTRSSINNTLGTTYDHFFVGSVDEIRLWRARLTAEVIKNNSRYRQIGGTAGLVAYYPFEYSTIDDGGQVITLGSLIDQSKETTDTTQLFAKSNSAISYNNNAPALKEAPNAVNVPFSFVASDNTIVINLESTPDRLEGCNINLTVRNVQDKNNNILESAIIWNVYVNQNQLKWSEDEIFIKQQSGEESNFTTEISNLSGKTATWSLVNLPSWLTASAYGGALPAISNANLTFTVSSALPIGNYESVVYLVGSENIYEPIIISVQVSGNEPNWSVDPNMYENSMNLIGQLYVSSLISEDSNDKVAAFIDGVCVGVASPAYYSRYDSYYVMMDIYGNNISSSKPINFKVWDASTGIIYPVVTTNLPINYIPNQLVGNMHNPLILNAEDKVEQSIDLMNGWNWNSFNTKTNNMVVEQVLDNVKNSVVMIKGKSAFAVPSSDSWAGNLSQVEIGKMYKIQMNENANLTLTGDKVDPSTTDITILPNWNWIGYTPNYNLAIADAFADLSPEDGDQVKGQTGFALYQDYEWVGTLKTLIPNKGYMYQSMSTVSKSFKYPNSNMAIRAPQRSPRANTTFTPVAENTYSGNMTLVGIVKNLGTVVSNCEVGVFVGNECRAAEIADENGMVFLTISGEGAGDLLNFRVIIDGATKELSQTLIYHDDNTIGSLDNPYPLQMVATAIDEISDNNIQVYPTRVIDNVYVVSSYVNIKSIKIMDANGRLIENNDNIDHYSKECLMSTFAPGVYLIVVETIDGDIQTFKVVKTTL